MKVNLQGNHRMLLGVTAICLLAGAGCTPAEQPPATPPKLPPVPPRPANAGGPAADRYKQLMGGKSSPYSSGKPAGGSTK